MGIFDVFGEILSKVAKKNEDDINVKTADPVVFEEVKKKVEEVDANLPSGGRRAGAWGNYEEKIKEAQVENEANPEVETADKSVFDDLLAEIKRLQEQEEAHGSAHETTGASPRPHIEQPVYIPPVQTRPLEPRTPRMPERQPQMHRESRAMSNSPGSLALRDAPSMQAGKLDIRVPNKSMLTILQYSDNSIMLDGQKSRFVLVEYQGQQGWILESYLNFN